MKLRLYRMDSGVISGKIVLTTPEVRHLFGKVPSRDKKDISNHFRVHQFINTARNHITIRRADVSEDTSRLDAPWLRPYGKVAWFITPTQKLTSRLSMDSYGKAQGTARDAFAELDRELESDGKGTFIRADVHTSAMDQPEPEVELTPEQKAHAALRLVNEYVAANEGKVLLSLNGNRAQLWTQPIG